MKHFLRLVAAPLLAGAFLLSVTSGPATADTTDTDTELAAEWQTAWDTYAFNDTTPPAPDSGRSRATTEISIQIDRPILRVFRAYSNLSNHIGINPFLKRVATHKDWRQYDTRYINLTAVEEIPYQGTIVTNKVHAQQRIHTAGFYYETDTWSEPNVVTHQKITFKPLSTGKTLVTESLTFDADATLIDFVAANGTASHQQTQAGLKEAIENGVI
ncbi:SRPBCC family protein [Nonomuraea sp. NPDC005983]|uniref:SRPBCC family protein n=1 Tax=Nonomuraea sp. NPDC005983 TaxID=3155595 RepID=UPI0033AB66F2